MINYQKLLFLILIFSLLKAVFGEKESSESSSSNNSGLSLASIFTIIIAVVMAIILFCYIASKIFERFCENNSIIQILKEEFEKNNLINNNAVLLEARKLNLNKIFNFLLENVFISSKYDESKNKYENNCTICLNNFKLEDKIYITQCEHIYHQNCMIKYLNLIRIDLSTKNIVGEMNNYFKCPNCKQYLFFNKKVDMQHKMQEKKLIDLNNVVLLVNTKNKKDSIDYEKNKMIITNSINDTPVSSARKNLKIGFINEESSLALAKKSSNNTNSLSKKYKNQKFISNNNIFFNNKTINNINDPTNFTSNKEKESNCQQKCLELKEHNSRKQSLNIIRKGPTSRALMNESENFGPSIEICSVQNEKEGGNKIQN